MTTEITAEQIERENQLLQTLKDSNSYNNYRKNQSVLTEAELHQQLDMLDEMLPMNTENPFWQRHELPYESVVFDRVDAAWNKAHSELDKYHQARDKAGLPFDTAAPPILEGDAPPIERPVISDQALASINKLQGSDEVQQENIPLLDTQASEAEKIYTTTIDGQVANSIRYNSAQAEAGISPSEQERRMLEKEARKAAEHEAMSQQQEGAVLADLQAAPKSFAENLKANNDPLIVDYQRDTLVKMLPVNSDNPFWQRHALPPNRDEFEEQVNHVLTELDRDNVAASQASETPPVIALNQQTKDMLAQRRAHDTADFLAVTTEADQPVKTEPQELPDTFSATGKDGSELDRNDIILPAHIVKRYIEVEGSFYHKQDERFAFADKGEKIATSGIDKNVISDMVDLAVAKQWKALNLSGSKEFRRETWLQAESKGIKTQGYTPSENDLQALKSLTAERSINTIAEAKPKEQKIAPRQPKLSSATMHMTAKDQLNTHIDVIKANPLYVGRSAEDVREIALLRSMLSLDVKDKPADQQSRILAKFDTNMADPRALEQMQKDKTTAAQLPKQDREQHHQHDGLSL